VFHAERLNQPARLSAAAVERAIETSRRSRRRSLGSPIHNGGKKTRSRDNRDDGGKRCGDPPAISAGRLYPQSIWLLTDVG
jgi:hypothetical protein